MPNQTKLVILTAEEILSLIKEKSVNKENLCISSKVSFLTIVKLLGEELMKILPLQRND